jgi:hypothetical protein
MLTQSEDFFSDSRGQGEMEKIVSRTELRFTTAVDSVTVTDSRWYVRSGTAIGINGRGCNGMGLHMDYFATLV